MDTVRDFILTPLSIKRLIYLVLTAIILYAIQAHSAYYQSYWLIWTGMLLSLITLGDSLKQRIVNITVTGILAACAVFLAGCLTALMPVLILYLFLVTCICFYISQRYPEYFIHAFIINVFVAVSTTMPVTLLDEMHRLKFMITGTIVAAVLQIIFYPHFFRKELHSYIIITMRSLKQLNEVIFSCFLDPEYADNIYLYERRLHEKKNRYMQSMARLREMTAMNTISADTASSYQSILNKLELLYENMLDYAQLRRRVSDYSTFSICSQELGEIKHEIDKSLDGVIAHLSNRKLYPNVDMLVQKIKRLEANYYNVLQVASREPLVFLIFMDSLNAFTQTVETLHAMKLTTNIQFT